VKNLLWFSAGVVVGAVGIPKAMHAIYIAAILSLSGRLWGLY
jgi:hypothetical protein